jgi:hypothetical protein
MHQARLCSERPMQGVQSFLVAPKCAVRQAEMGMSVATIGRTLERLLIEIESLAVAVQLREARRGKNKSERGIGPSFSRLLEDLQSFKVTSPISFANGDKEPPLDLDCGQEVFHYFASLNNIKSLAYGTQ